MQAKFMARLIKPFCIGNLEIAMSYLSFLNEDSDITDITWRNRTRFAPLDAFSQHIMRGDSELSIAHRELIAGFVSALNECQFCYGSHNAVAQQFGIEPELIERLLESIDDSNIMEKLKPILKYARKLTITPSRIVKSDIEAITRSGWSEKTVEDVIAIVCLFNFYNRLLDGHGVKGKNSIYAFAGKHLSKRGYGVPWFIKWIAPLINKQKRNFIENYKQ